MAIAEKIIPHYTYHDWLHWEGRWELIEGHPIAMSPTPIPAHQRVAAELITELTLAIRKSRCKSCKVYDALDYKISDDTILVPDIMIICGEVKKKYLDFAPALVVEILSPSTALRDRHTKFKYYEQQGVKYYLLVDVNRRNIDVYALENKSYSLQKPADIILFQLEKNCSISPDCTHIFD